MEEKEKKREEEYEEGVKIARTSAAEVGRLGCQHQNTSVGQKNRGVKPGSSDSGYVIGRGNEDQLIRATSVLLAKNDMQRQ